MNRILSSVNNLSVEVHTITGSIYQGVLSKFGEKNIILKAVILFDGTEFKTIDHVHIELSKIALLITAKFPIVPKNKNKGFTDGEISTNKNTKRELVKFDIPDDYVQDDLKNDEGHWDQFEVNEKKFGVTTSYDESLYTTKLDKTSKEYKSREKEAIRIAKEIETKSTSNPHLKEERGQAAQMEIDEETKYSQVQTTNYTLPKPKTSFASIAAQKQLPNSKTNESIDKAQKQINAFKQTEKRKVQHKKNEEQQKLIDFSKSFKLKTPMPDDIKELLNKPAPESQAEPAEEAAWNWNVEAPEFQPDYYLEPEVEPINANKFLSDDIQDKNVKLGYKDLFPTPIDDSADWQIDPNAPDYDTLYYMPQYYAYSYYDFNSYYYNYEQQQFYNEPQPEEQTQ
eukprot:NODE_59_length_25653_cov_0.289622.p5 type:complete len:397 gc:universal NODE_59_length_25653_cov_0.289622:18218-19408(+)